MLYIIILIKNILVIFNLLNCVFVFVFLQEGFCEFSHSARELSQDSSMKTALFAAASVGLAGLTFLLVR